LMSVAQRSYADFLLDLCFSHRIPACLEPTMSL
jgi:hypothetical protein